jgi:hypothetical protein
MQNLSETSRDAVPPDTIRNTWDFYDSTDWNGTNFGKTHGITRITGREYDNLHTQKICEGIRCRRGYYKGKFESGKVPIGAYARLYDGRCTSNDITNNIVYGNGAYSVLNQKLDDETATNCAGGSALGFDKYPTRPSKYKSSNDNVDLTNQCFFGPKIAHDKDQENCIIAGLQYPIFCQLGDYAGTIDKCKAKCNNIRSTDGSTNGACYYALDRLCGKTIEDNVKKNSLNELIKSDRNWIKDPVCQQYCGGAREQGSALCQKHKADYCRNKNSWPDAAQYCHQFWTFSPNFGDMNEACKSKLSTAASPENITTNNGCGYLCRGQGLDVNKQWCESRAQDFCTANHNNMETNYCFNFCKDHPDLCEDYLQTDFCKGKEGLLDNEVGTTGKLYSDYCGCMMPTKFYNDYKDSVFKQYKDAGYTIEGIASIRTEPECMYPGCKSGSILTSDQRANIGTCGSDCVQIMLNNYDSASINADLIAQQSAQCARIMPVAPGGTSEPPPTSPPPATTAAPPATTTETPPATTTETPPATTTETPPATTTETPPATTTETPPATTETPSLPGTTGAPPTQPEPPPEPTEPPPEDTSEPPPEPTQPVQERDQTFNFDVSSSGGQLNVAGAVIGALLTIVFFVLLGVGLYNRFN